MSKNLFETYEVNGKTYTDNLGENALISIPKKQYIEYEQQKEENQRLNNIIKEIHKTLEDNYGGLPIIEYERLIDLTKEKSLNNSINEFEKWLKSEIKRLEELQNPAKSKIKPYGEEYNNYTLLIGAYDNALDKLQELKGDSGNE